jgi:hypothetical protein
MSRWGQLQMGNLTIGVMQHEYRKSPSIIVRRGSVIYTTAYCRSEEEADRFWEALLEITGAVDGREAA